LKTRFGFCIDGDEEDAAARSFDPKIIESQPRTAIGRRDAVDRNLIRVLFSIFFRRKIEGHLSIFLPWDVRAVDARNIPYVHLETREL
jgi:hypothetical protein